MPTDPTLDKRKQQEQQWRRKACLVQKNPGKCRCYARIGNVQQQTGQLSAGVGGDLVPNGAATALSHLYCSAVAHLYCRSVAQLQQGYLSRSLPCFECHPPPEGHGKTLDNQELSGVNCCSDAFTCGTEYPYLAWFAFSA